MENPKKKKACCDERHFFVDNHGWVTGEDESDDGEDCWLLYTKDGGKTWAERKFYNIGVSYPGFLNKDRGVLTSENGWIIITNDGGKTWAKKRKPIRKHPWHFSEIFTDARSSK